MIVGIINNYTIQIKMLWIVILNNIYCMCVIFSVAVHRR